MCFCTFLLDLHINDIWLSAVDLILNSLLLLQVVNLFQSTQSLQNKYDYLHFKILIKLPHFVS